MARYCSRVPTNGFARPPVALVGGAASGIGAACLERLRADGFRTVAAHHRSPVGPGPSVVFDTTDEAAIDGVLDRIENRWGVPEVVVCAAGIAHRDLAVRLPAQRFRDIVDLDLTGTFLLARAAIARMLPLRRGRVILIGSAAADIGVPGLAAYTSAKAGLAGLARTLAREAGRRGITVNVVSPGLLDDAAARFDRTGSAPIRSDWAAETPLGRVGRPREVAAVVGHLASPEGGAITGAVIAVDGGVTTPRR